jgi:hypothetical protein
MNAKKPSNLHFEDFKQWLEELDDYLPYLPGPLNQHLGDDQLFVTLKKCVSAWQKKYTDSNARKNIDNVNVLKWVYWTIVRHIIKHFTWQLPVLSVVDMTCSWMSFVAV